MCFRDTFVDLVCSFCFLFVTVDFHFVAFVFVCYFCFFVSLLLLHIFCFWKSKKYKWKPGFISRIGHHVANEEPRGRGLDTAKRSGSHYTSGCLESLPTERLVANPPVRSQICFIVAVPQLLRSLRGDVMPARSPSLVLRAVKTTAVADSTLVAAIYFPLSMPTPLLAAV